jgi:hypothetical protein
LYCHLHVFSSFIQILINQLSALISVGKQLINYFFGSMLFLNCEIFIGFWCHEDSPLIHPVGWAQQTNHHLDADPEYISRCRAGVFLDNDAVPELFAQPKLSFLHEDVKIVTGMKLEAIDPLNLSAICVATVMNVSILNY